MGSVVKNVTDSIGITSGDTDGARNDQANGLAEAQQYWQQAYKRQMDAVDPYQKAGLAGLAGLQHFDYQQDPGYQFRLQQGLNGINNSMAARGLSNSGSTLKALLGYNQNFASNEYNNAYNRNFQTMSALAGIGQNAYQNAANYAGQLGNLNGQGKIGIGNFNAAADMYQGGKMTNLLNQGIQAGAAVLSGGMTGLGGKMSPGGGGVSSQVMPSSYNNSFTGLAGYQLPNYG